MQHTPFKIKERDLDPALLAMFAKGGSDITRLLQDYVKKNQAITEEQIPASFKNSLKVQIDDLADKIKNCRKKSELIAYADLADDVKTKLSSLEVKINSAGNSGSTAGTKEINELKQFIDELRGKLSVETQTRSTDVNNLSGRISSLESAATSTVKQSTIDGLNNKVASLEKSVSDAKGLVNAQNDKMKSLRQKDDDIEESELTLALQNKLQKMRSDIDYLLDSIKAVVAKVIAVPGAKAGQYIYANSNAGSLSAKDLFVEIGVAEDSEDLNDLKQKGLVLIYNAADTLYYEKIGSGYTGTKKVVSANLFGTLLVDSKSKTLHGYIMPDGTIHELSSKPKSRTVTLNAGATTSIDRENNNEFMAPTVYAKYGEKQVTVGGQNVKVPNYINASHLVTVVNEYDKYTLKNESDETLTLLIKEH